MSKFVKEEVKELSISGIRQFNTIANEIDGVIKLTIGELDFNTPDDVKTAAINAIKENKTRYTKNAGIDELRTAISKQYDSLYTEEEIILTVGTTEALSILIQAVIEQGDDVMIPTPGYVGYEPLIHLQQGTVSYLDMTKTDFKITKESLENQYHSKVKMMIITNPNNPTGQVLSRTEMDTIAEFVSHHDILLVADEIYSETSEEFTSFSSYDLLKDNLIILNGFSKSHAMTGFRIGYLLAPKNLALELIKIHQYNVTSTSTISQYAALRAMDSPTDYLKETLKHRRELVLNCLDKLSLNYVPPSGAFYVFFDISSTSLNSEEFCLKFLKEHKVALIPGQYFLGNHDTYVRLSYAVDEASLLKALQQLEIFIKKETHKQ